MTDDQVVNALLPSALAGRLDVQNAAGVSPKAIQRTEAQLKRAMAVSLAQRHTLTDGGRLLNKK